MSIAGAPRTRGASRRAEHTTKRCRRLPATVGDCRRPGDDKMATMARIPESTPTSLRQRLLARAGERWPEIDQLHTGCRRAAPRGTGDCGAAAAWVGFGVPLSKVLAETLDKISS